MDQQIYPRENISLDAETRVWLAVYLLVLNQGIMTQEGALLNDGIEMRNISNSAEVSFDYAIKAVNGLRKVGFMKNRKDGRLVVKLEKLEESLLERGAPVD